MVNRDYRLFLCTLAIVVAGGLGDIHPAAAQEQQGPDAAASTTTAGDETPGAPDEQASRGKLDEIIITAQKREKRLQDVPMAVSAFSREMIEDQEINDIADLAKLVPSMRITPADDPTNASLRVRGVGTNVFSISVEPNVSVVVDEVPLARTAMASFEFADLERVEVLRGPQGTLFGKNASAGLIHVISRDPAPEFEAFVRLNHEEADQYTGRLTNLQSGISGPVADDWGVRLTGFYKTIEGHLINSKNGEKIPGKDAFGARAKLMWDVSSAIDVRWSIEHQVTRGESTPFVWRSANPDVASRSPEIPYGAENRTTSVESDLISDIDSFGTSFKVNWDLGAVALTAITGFRYFDMTRDLGIADLDGDRIDLDRNGGERDIRTFTQEIRLSSTDTETLEYTVGALWFDTVLNNKFEQNITDIPTTYLVTALLPVSLPIPLSFPTIPIALPGESYTRYAITNDQVQTQNLGVFAQGTWHATERLHITVGGRFIYEKQIGDQSQRAVLFNDTTGIPITDDSFHIREAVLQDTTGTGTFSAQYDWTEGSMIYATVSTGYRGGAFDFASDDSADAFANPVEPETAISFEIGTKSRLFDNRMELNVTAFHTAFENFQAQVIDLSNDGENPVELSTLAFNLQNAGELETKGIEVDFQAKPFASLFLFGSVLYNEAIFKEFVTQCFPGQEPGEAGGVDDDGDGTCDRQDVSGGVLPNAPEWSVNLTARYEHMFNQIDGRAYVQISGRWVDDIQFSSEQHPLTIQEAHQIWDLRLGWIGFGERVEVAAYVKNLFGENFAGALTPFSLTNDRRDIVQFLPRDTDRIFGLSAGYQF